MANQINIDILNKLTQNYDGEANAELPEEGDVIFDIIEPLFRDPDVEKIILDFNGIPSFTNSFINNAVGKLFLVLEKSTINDKLVFTGLTNNQDVLIIKESIKNALEFASKQF